MITVTIQAETPAIYKQDLQTLMNGLGAVAPVAPVAPVVTLEVDGVKLAEAKATAEELAAKLAEAEAAKKAAAKKAEKEAKAKAAKEAAEAAAKAEAEAAEADDDDLEVDGASDDAPISQWTKEQVEKKLKDLARNGFNDQVKEIIASTGAPRLSAIAPEFYHDVMDQAEALG